MLSNFRIILVSSACAVLSGCFGPTPYQVKAYNGGYDDKPVNSERHFVAFYGNGFTSREAVLKYWLYRCAEVTSKAGFDYFVLLSRNPRPSAALDGDSEIARVVDIQRLAPDEAVLAKGASGGSVPIYVPGGGGSVTRWSASGVIAMYKGEPPDPNPVTFVAKDLLEKLGPEVRAGVVPGQGYKLPDPGTGTNTAEYDPAGPGGGGGNEPVKLDDLKDLLPK